MIDFKKQFDHVPRRDAGLVDSEFPCEPRRRSAGDISRGCAQDVDVHQSEKEPPTPMNQLEVVLRRRLCRRSSAA